jgi:hypothetical protein
MVHREAKEILYLDPLSCTSLCHGKISHQTSATTQPDRPDCIPALGGYPDGFSIKFTLHHQKFRFLSKSLEVNSDYMPRTSKVLKAATFGRMDKHEKREQKMIMFGFCKKIIRLNTVAT